MSKAIVERIEQILDDPAMDYEKLKVENKKCGNDPRKLSRATAFYVCVHVADTFSQDPDATVEEMNRLIEIDSMDYDDLARRIVEKFKLTG